MSVEKETSAHRTLTTRAFYRALKRDGDTKPYFDYLESRISFDELCALRPDLWDEVKEETLTGPKALGEDNELIHSQLKKIKKKYKNQPWVVIGGPPCQAYSLVGRSRNKGITGYTPESDDRHFLYQEYLEVLAEIQPDVFVMENVKGILTAKVHGSPIFPTILEDLEFPVRSSSKKSKGKGPRYSLHSFVVPPDKGLVDSSTLNPEDFIIRSEEFGVPQARHRVILLGIREDDSRRNKPGQIARLAMPVKLKDVIGKLPRLRSKLSKNVDDPDRWREEIVDQISVLAKEYRNRGQRDFANFMMDSSHRLRLSKKTRADAYGKGGPSVAKSLPSELADWLLTDAPSRLLNHETRGHLGSDLARYFFSASWASFYRTTSPKASDFPSSLRPDHANWDSGHFADRFRVQLADRPATTVTSHISKDGHYFIHYDPAQCRSLTVREAARIQTFPDNYFFEGNRTQQYVQVGNAVPPFLAHQIAGVVAKLIFDFRK